MPADYFMTLDTTELQQAVASLGYGNSQNVCWMFPSQQPGTSPLYRLLYQAGPGIHFYTTDQSEADSCVSSHEWTLEGIAGYLYPTPAMGTVPLYRLATDVTHIYTTSATERDGLLMCPGWVFEGIIGYVYDSPQTGTAQVYRVWQPDTIPSEPPSHSQDDGMSSEWVIHVVNNSRNPLLVSGTSGSDLSSVTVNQVIPPFGGSLNVANFLHMDYSASYDWIYLRDLISPQRYQIYVEALPISMAGNTSSYFGYYDPTSSQSNGNPSPFPAGFCSTEFNSSQSYIVCTLTTTPPLVTTDLQAVTDQLGFLLTGKSFQWSASTDFDTSQHPELAPYVLMQTASQVADQVVYGDQDQFTVSSSYPSTQTGCFQNPATTATTNPVNASATKSVTFNWSMTETLSVAWGYQVKAGLPDSVGSTTTWQVNLSVGSTQGESQTNSVTFGETANIPIPAQTTVVWCVTFTDQTYTIPITVPVTLTGSVAIESATPLSPTQISAIAGQQFEIPSGQWLILVPIGALVQFGAGQSAGIASLGFTLPPASPQQVQFNMTGESNGGPITQIDIGLQLYANAPACSSSLTPPPPGTNNYKP